MTPATTDRKVGHMAKPDYLLQGRSLCTDARKLLIAQVDARGKEAVAADLMSSVRTVERVYKGFVPRHNLARRILATLGGRK